MGGSGSLLDGPYPAARDAADTGRESFSGTEFADLCAGAAFEYGRGVLLFARCGEPSSCGCRAHLLQAPLLLGAHENRVERPAGVSVPEHAAFDARPHTFPGPLPQLADAQCQGRDRIVSYGALLPLYDRQARHAVSREYSPHAVAAGDG